MANYYRIALDFSYTETPEDLETIFDSIVDAVVKIIDNHEPGAECLREWTVFANDVTDEYIEDDIKAFKSSLGDEDALKNFMDSIQYKDYPTDASDG